MEKNYWGEISHKFDPKFYEETYMFVKNFGLLYLFVNKYSIKGLNNLEGLNESLIFSPNHESHFDYVLLSYILYDKLSIVPRIAGGKNLFIGSMNNILRKLGGFCVDRENKSEEYIKQLEEYMIDLILKGENTLNFIQGGRVGYLRLNKKDVFSRPKTGLLGACIKAQERTEKNLLIVPVDIKYDHSPEEWAFHLLDKSKKIKNKPLSNLCYYGSDFLVYSLRVINPIKSGVYVTFGEPFSIKGYLEKLEKEFNRELSDKEKRKCLVGKIIRDIKKLSLEDKLIT